MQIQNNNEIFISQVQKDLQTRKWKIYYNLLRIGKNNRIM